MPFALLVAFAASLGIHVMALFVPDIKLSPLSEPVPQTIEVVLQPRRAPQFQAQASAQPRAIPAQKLKPKLLPKSSPKVLHKAKPKAVPKPVKPDMPASSLAVPSNEDRTQDQAEAASDAVADAAKAAAEREVVARAEAAAAAESAKAEQGAEKGTPLDLNSPDLPPSGRITYVVTARDGATVGTASHSWEMANGRYRIGSVMETTGLAALISSVRLETESRGRMTDNGLQPEQYVSRRVDKNRVEQVNFDWSAGVARFANGNETPLKLGAQDLLSFNYQLGWLAKTGNMSVATGRKLGIYRLELVGKELLDTPVGLLSTLHFRAAGETTTEVWLAVEQYLLPVKIRHIDKKGERYEQIMQDIQLNTPRKSSN